MRARFFLIAFLLCSPARLMAGVYGGTSFCPTDSDCLPLSFASDPLNTIPPFAITHPAGYDGAGGILEYRICVGQGSEILKAPLARAIDTWNALVATTGNCSGCKVWEDAVEEPSSGHAETTILHELGHCPLGLDHPDRNWDTANDGFWEPSSFTRSWDVDDPPGGIQVGADFVRGTLDDVHQSSGGMIPESVHWFRKSDNDPFVVDSTVVDSSTYSRSVVNDLPTGHSWAANANREVSERLGYEPTQAVMYSRTSEFERKTSLSADDVAMIRMGMTGQDRLAGTADDYTIQLTLVDPCEDPVDVVVLFGATLPDAFAFCEVGYDFSFPQNPFLAFHTSAVPLQPNTPFLLILNDQLAWDVGDQVFDSGFETGDTSEWDGVFASGVDP